MAPDVWNTALAFGLFGFFIGIVLFVVICVALVVDRGDGGGGGGGGGGNPAKSEYD
jgi:preprotein translocase subunit SecG